jgi:hypothetical protein
MIWFELWQRPPSTEDTLKLPCLLLISIHILICAYVLLHYPLRDLFISLTLDSQHGNSAAALITTGTLAMTAEIDCFVPERL